MSRRSKDNTAGQGKHFNKGFFYPPEGGYLPSGTRPPSVSAQRREALSETIGAPFDRDPCPHVRRTYALVPPSDAGPTNGRVAFLVPGQAVVKTTDAPCVRPAGHARESRLIPDKHGATVTVPDEAARLHADTTGRTWK